MDNNLLHTYIRQVSTRIADGDISLIAGCAESRDYKKGAVLLKEGEVCRAFYLVHKGCLRAYYNKDGVEVNMSFTFEGEFTTNLRSVNGRRKSELNIEAGEKTSVWVFDLDAMAEQIRDHAAVERFIRRLSVRILLASEEHSNLIKLHTPAERYQYIEQNRPELLQRISLSQLSSYLGVTRETLSRIRSKR